ncbi:MAG: cyclic nucleotide-binding domain-containing protein [Anaerolineales bacterium]|nr:cyclic nucleotide-binding domain-containing protein [Anaerolineales bacterium]
MIHQDILDFLRKTSVFKGLSDDLLRTLTESAMPRILAAGETLIKKGEVGNSLFIISQGWVKIVTEDSKGDELILNKCGAGEVIGEMSLFDSGLRSASVIALEAAQVLEISRAIFMDVLDKNPEVGFAIILSYSDRLRHNTTYIEKAIDWSQKTAAGDYSFIEATQPLSVGAGASDDKATELLSAFFTMVRKVKEREDGLKKQLEQLTFEIDQTRRKQDFEEITSTEFYANLKEQARTLRQKRNQS